MSNDQPPGEPARDDDPPRPPPRPVAPPGQVSTPDQLPTVEPGEWPAQPRRAPVPQPAPPPAPAPAPVPTSAPPAPGPPAPPPVAPAKRSLAWLWVTLAAVFVLGVGTAATLVVVRPWEDDTSDRDTAGAPPDSEQQAEPSDEVPEDPAPTASATPTPPSAPAAQVTADLDGDGYGDAVAVLGSSSSIERVVLSSTGSSFEVAREPVAAFEDRTWADFDGDGELDEVSWTYELGGTLNLTSDDLDLRERNLRLRLDDRQPFVSLKPGDFDGDGAVDLVAYGATGRRTVGVWIIRNEAGRFAEPEQWVQIPNATYATTTLLPADFDADGRADVAARVPSSGLPRDLGPSSRIELGIALLTSSGTGFVPGPVERPTGLLDGGEAVVGDFTGDGQPRVLLIDRSRTGVQVHGLRADGDRLVLEPGLVLQIGGRRGDVVDAVVSDVDGDAVDDVVYSTVDERGRSYDGFRVLRLDERATAPSEVWAPTPRCPSGDCSFYFENSF
ncbi:FG-GAP repeat domain-containing protein [Nocardioides bizhenqiangii]|uniref:FG-GAP-like repeat-containing protein n=1 Tax=Nocardioides bizhenqiangii TaxID=3095076 RepID=A0ABZ0ZTU4_9ACTN|nr:FG-GAP-like repeat-containing protein [Nocardioides sp. HM61]WQQ27336.1 FG-GAP-like repeat-containing protein [Nocardioides sp. HM61]